MKVSEAIDRLKVGEKVWVKGTFDLRLIDTEEIRLEFSDACSGLWLNGEQEISLTEPQAEKVEVKEEQAELLKRCEGESIYYLLGECTEEEEELLVKARLFGYTVKPKRWVVKMATGYFMDFEEGCNEEGFEWVSSSKSCCLVFTEKSKAEAVAILVEGSVEEV